MNKILNNIIRLRKYFQLSCFSDKVKKRDLLSTNEALRNFGKLWIENKNDVLTMAEVIKYEILADENYDKGDVARIKQTLGRTIKFLMECADEWEEFEQLQRQRQEQMKGKK